MKKRLMTGRLTIAARSRFAGFSVAAMSAVLLWTSAAAGADKADSPPRVVRQQELPIPPDPSSKVRVDEATATRERERIETQVMVPGPVAGAIWVAQGPAPIRNGQSENASPNNEVAGAIHVVAAHPSNSNILYLGAVNGGVWRTDNATVASPSWTPLTDSLPSMAIGALEFDPTDATNNTLVAGIGLYSSFGRVGPRRTGLLRTADGGSTWTPLDGGGLLLDKNISGVAPRGSTIVVSVNFATPNNCSDLGIFRSVDGGTSFTRIAGSGAGLPSSRSYDLVGDPTSSSTLYTVADCAETCDVGGNGIYKSTDTGATWSKVSTAAMDALITCGPTSNVEMSVGQSGEAYVAVLNFGQIINGGIFRSSDGGTTWTQMDVPAVPASSGVVISNATNATPIAITSFGHGLSTGTRVNVSGVIGNTAANGLFTVTVVDGNSFTLDGSTGNGAYGGGGQWTLVVGVNPRFKEPDPDPFSAGGQGSIHFSIVADPSNNNVVYIGGDRQDFPFPNFIGAVNFSGNLWRGDASQAFTGAALSPQWKHLTHSNSVGAIVGGGTASASSPHADSREMAIDASGNLIEGDDGGVFRRTSPGNNSGNWFSINSNLQATEMHDVAYDSLSNVIFGGNQDNANAFQTAPDSLVWDTVFTSGDGGDVAVDTVTLAGSGQSIRYTSAQLLQGFARSTWDSANNLISIVGPSLTLVGGGNPIVVGGSGNVDFKTPIELNAVVPARMIIGGASSVYESLDMGDTVREISPGIGVNGFRSDPIAYGHAGNVDVLYVGSGSSIHVRTAAFPAPLALTAFAGGFVRDVVLDAGDWRTLYVVDGDEACWVTTDAGTSWINITGDLTGVGELVSIDFMDNTTMVTGTSSDFLVVGADLGVFVMDPLVPGVWSELGTNLPNAPVYDLDYDGTDDVLVASTMGRGAWTARGVVSCPPVSNCDDSDICTFDQCVGSTCAHQVNIYGDVDFNNAVNLFDLFCVLDGFNGVFAGNCTFQRMDIEPCNGNNSLNLFDLFAILDAFSGTDPCCGP